MPIRELRNYKGNRAEGPGNFLIIPNVTNPNLELFIVTKFNFSNQILVSNYSGTIRTRKGVTFGYN